MNAKLERQLRFLCAIIVAGALASIAVNVAQGRVAWPQLVAALSYTFVSCVVIGGLELFVLQGPLSERLRRLSFVALLAVRSAIYAVIIVVIQLLQIGERVAGFQLQTSLEDFGAASPIRR